MENTEYRKPELYLYLNHYKASGGLEYIEAHIVKVEWDKYWEADVVKAVDAKDFSKDGSHVETRWFDAWSPNLRYYINDTGRIYNHSKPEYTDQLFVDQNKAEYMLKTLKSLNNSMERIANKEGYSQNFIETIIRFGRVCKVSGIITSGTFSRGDSGVLMNPRIEQMRYAHNEIKNFFQKVMGGTEIVFDAW